MVNTTNTLNAATLRKAADLTESIERQQAELTALLTGKTVTFKSTKTKDGGGKRQMTPEQKARIAAGATARWAKVRAAKAAAEKATASAPSTPVS